MEKQMIAIGINWIQFFYKFIQLNFEYYECSKSNLRKNHTNIQKKVPIDYNQSSLDELWFHKLSKVIDPAHFP